MLENTEGVMKKDNPEKMVNKGTQDTLSFVIAPVGII
jgi:hypothetical protein